MYMGYRVRPRPPDIAYYGSPLSGQGEKAAAGNAQGIEAEIPQVLPQVKPRNWSGKPGFWREAPKMRPKEEKFPAFVPENCRPRMTISLLYAILTI
jgi:hypothetical protein